MRHGWLAGLILSFSFLTLTLSTSFGQSPAEGFQGLSPDDVKEIREMLRYFQKPLPEKAYTPLLDKSEDLSEPGRLEETIEKLYPGLEPEIRNSSSKRAQGIPLDRIKKEDTWYYFFSFSMPEDSIKRAIVGAVDLRAQGIPIIMVLRGLVDNKLKTTAVKVYALLKELKADVPFEINPELFEEAGVKAVPALTKTGAGVLLGDVSIRWAIEKLKEGPRGQGKWGNTYEIGEDDILQYIGSKQAMVEAKLRERMEKIGVMKGNIYVLDKYEGRFPKAKKDAVYLIDPTYTLREDMRDQNGNVLFKKGMKANPAAYASLGRYVIIDGNDPKQVEFAMAGNFRKIILVSGDLAKLMAQYKQRFYFVNDRIIDLVKLKKVPVVFEQEGSHVKVTEKKL
jgi:conjugal transfer pilus assembly protein TraW